MIHRRTHANLDVEGCFACRIAQVAIAPSATGSAFARQVNETEAEWERDIPAYCRLRRNGVQPPGIDGAARLEATANSKAEVEQR